MATNFSCPACNSPVEVGPALSQPYTAFTFSHLGREMTLTKKDLREAFDLDGQIKVWLRNVHAQEAAK